MRDIPYQLARLHGELEEARELAVDVNFASRQVARLDERHLSARLAGWLLGRLERRYQRLTDSLERQIERLERELAASERECAEV